MQVVSQALLAVSFFALSVDNFYRADLQRLTTFFTLPRRNRDHLKKPASRAVAKVTFYRHFTLSTKQ